MKANISKQLFFGIILFIPRPDCPASYQQKNEKNYGNLPKKKMTNRPHTIGFPILYTKSSKEQKKVTTSADVQFF